MSRIAKFLDDQGRLGVQTIQTNLDNTGTTTTGKTKDSITYEVTEDNGRTTLIIKASRPYFKTVETGSKPAKTTVPPKEMVESLKEWAQAKGSNVSPYGAAVNILKKGSELYRKGGRTDIYTPVKDQIMQNLRENLGQLKKLDGKEYIFR